MKVVCEAVEGLIFFPLRKEESSREAGPSWLYSNDVTRMDEVCCRRLRREPGKVPWFSG